MKTDKKIETPISQELPDDWWYRVYAAVIVTTIIVITILGIFTRYFSN